LTSKCNFIKETAVNLHWAVFKAGLGKCHSQSPSTSPLCYE